jgi:hypothetical protein
MSAFYPPPEELAPSIERYLIKKFDVGAEDVKVTSVDYRFTPEKDNITVNVSVRLPPVLVGPIIFTVTKRDDDGV